MPMPRASEGGTRIPAGAAEAFTPANVLEHGAVQSPGASPLDVGSKTLASDEKRQRRVASPRDGEGPA